jgi:AcrR family transcriptional regulator
MVVRTRRERLHDATREEIKSIARQHMAEQGAAAISLRAIAREMGLSAPALYRYYNSRDELITALIVDAYNAIADAVEAASRKPAPDDYGQRAYVALMTYREWALAHPADYMLILGNPIPGYHAPEGVTTPAAQRTIRVFLDLMQHAWREGRLNVPAEYVDILPRFLPLISDEQRYGTTIPHPLLEMVLSVWGQMHGLISLELYHHLQPIVRDPGELYCFEVVALLTRLGLAPRVSLRDEG